MRQVTIIGCGYTGLRLARRWLGLGAQVSGHATRPQSLAAIRECGADAHALDLDAAPAPLDLDGRLVYYSVPPAADADGDPRLERFLAGVAGRPARIVYLSTTGVYGDHRGGEVDEDTPVDPLSARAARRVAAETALRTWADARALSWCMLRIAAIYGPGRLPLERLRRGEPALQAPQAPPSGPGNRIHVEDLVSACIAAGTAAQADRRIYNISDGSFDSPAEFLQRVAELAGLPAPRAAPQSALPALPAQSAQAFAGESRRVVNRRMLEELGVVLAYPQMDAGIRASLAAR